MNINRSKHGFIQIPILVAIIVGVFVVGGAGYVGVKQYQSHQQAQKAIEEAKPQNEQTTSNEQSEVEKLRQEVNELKKQQKSPTTPKTKGLTLDELNAPPAKTTPQSSASTVNKSKPTPEVVLKESNAAVDAKSQDNNVVAAKENFSTFLSSLFTTEAKSYKDLVDLSDDMIESLDSNIDALKTEIAEHEGYKAVLGADKAPISDAYISDYNSDINRINQYKAAIITQKDSANNGVLIYKNNALKASSKFISKEDFLFNANSLKNDEGWNLQMKYLSQIFDYYKTYRKERDNYYVKIDAELRALLYTMRNNTGPSIPTYQPQIVPVFQMPQFPKTTTCTLSGDGGVGLQAYVNCITY